MKKIHAIFFTGLLSISLNAFAELYEHGSALLYCELTCQGTVSQKTVGAYKLQDDDYVNIGEGLWIDTGSKSRSEKVYFVEDEKFEDATRLCQSEMNSLKNSNNEIRRWIRSNKEANCFVSPYATVSLVGFLSGHAYSQYNHDIVPKSDVVGGVDAKEPYYIDMFRNIQEFKAQNPELKHAPLLNFNKHKVDL